MMWWGWIGVWVVVFFVQVSIWFQFNKKASDDEVMTALLLSFLLVLIESGLFHY